MHGHVTCLVSDDGVRVSLYIIYQAVAFADSVGGRVLLLCGDIV